MHSSNIFEGKTTNEAIEKGLKELKVNKNEVDIKVIENEDKRSFFDILTPRIVRVEMTIKDNSELRKDAQKRIEKREEKKIDIKVLENVKKKIDEFMEKFIKQTTGNSKGYECFINDNVIKVNITEKSGEFLIGYRGDTLNSLQTILTSIAMKEAGEKVRVEVDALGYRDRRTKALEELAEKISKTVIRNRKSVTLEPMTPFERKIIHTALQDNKDVTTVSIGDGTHRRVVVSLKNEN